ncbi:hypothetical protein HOY80DRAFT_960818 [Tuber brumale]|nr:hypothetical protein HOY80DRAFT_960818 [Tuber brumale]
MWARPVHFVSYLLVFMNGYFFATQPSKCVLEFSSEFISFCSGFPVVGSLCKHGAHLLFCVIPVSFFVPTGVGSRPV